MHAGNVSWRCLVDVYSFGSRVCLLLFLTAGIVSGPTPAFAGSTDLRFALKLPDHPREDWNKKVQVVVYNSGKEHERVHLKEVRYRNGAPSGESDFYEKWVMAGGQHVYSARPLANIYNTTRFKSFAGKIDRVFTLYYAGNVLGVHTLRFQDGLYLHDQQVTLEWRIESIRPASSKDALLKVVCFQVFVQPSVRRGTISGVFVNKEGVTYHLGPESLSKGRILDSGSKKGWTLVELTATVRGTEVSVTKAQLLAFRYNP